MRLLLQESLAYGEARSARFPARRPETFNIKKYGLPPVVNIARWPRSAWIGGSCRPPIGSAAAGSAMLPADAAATLIEVFDVLQRLRLRYQIRQYRAGEQPTDVVTLKLLSPLDRSVIAQAVREISAAQRRMDNVSQFVAVEEWVSPGPA
jgi:CBS domain-containing protein